MICIARSRSAYDPRPTRDAKIIHPCRRRRGRRQGNSGHSHRLPYILSASVTPPAIGASLVVETCSCSKVCRCREPPSSPVTMNYGQLIQGGHTELNLAAFLCSYCSSCGSWLLCRPVVVLLWVCKNRWFDGIGLDGEVGMLAC
uniref:Uncharacterized protein n=1 Tax=Zea mays TaxID=4577 RepID=B6UAD1_MAIZE|nr:hypothetical protein [Zea mays]